jgi:hypothetical protein
VSPPVGLRSLSFVIAAVGVALLIAGFAFGSDLLGFFFMVCIVLAIVLFVASLVLQRRQAA